MIHLIKFYYLLSIVFIFLEIYQFVYRKKLFYENKKIKSKSYLFFGILKLIYVVWIPIGFFSNLNKYYIFLFLLGFGKIFTLWFKKEIINLYDILNFIISIFLLSKIFISIV